MRNFTFGGVSEQITGWKVSKARDSRATFTCLVRDYVPSVDEEVGYFNNSEYFITADGEKFITADNMPFITAGTPIFKGIIIESKPVRDGMQIIYEIAAVDYSKIADDRLTSFVCYNMTAAEIITEKLLPILTEEGVTLGTIDTGALITKCVMPWKTLTQILDTLAEVSGGYYWTIDIDKKLQFLSPESRNSGVTIDANTLLSNLKYSKNSDEYRNVQVVVGAATPTAPQTETAQPDGSTYKTRFPVQSQPRIWVGGVESTSVGVSGLDSGTDWTWSYQSTDITYNGETAPAEIVITYTGLYSVVARSKNQTEINRKKALTGGSGIKEVLYTDENINSSVQAQQYCSALLDKNAKDGESVSFTTEDAPAYKVGETVTIIRAEMAINGVYEVLKMVMSAASPTNIKYEVTFCNGTARTWDTIFAALFNKANSVSIGADEVATTLKDVSEGCTIGGAYVISTFTQIYPATNLYPAANLYPGSMQEVATVND